jgi:hypothetical protein
MDAGLTFRLPKRTIAVLLVIAAALAMLIARPGRSGELPVYMKAAERILHGEQIYRTDEVSAFTYPPFFVLPMLPLAPLSPLLQIRAWWFVNLCLAGVILIITARLVWPTVANDQATSRNRWILAVLVVVLAGRFFISPLEYKSHDLIVLALIVAACYAMTHRRDGWAGICLGLAAACKATPLLFLPMLLWQRRYRATACFAAAMLAATLAPDLLFPAPDRQLWVVHWYAKFISKVHVDAPAQAAGAWSSWNMLNQGLAATIYRLSAPVESGGGMFNVCLVHLSDACRQWLTLASELLVTGWLVWRTWPRQKPGFDPEPGVAILTQSGMVICAMLLLSPMSSSQHFGALLVPVTACSTYWMYRRRDPFVAAALLLVFLFGTLAARDILGSYSVWPQAVGCKTWLTLALMLACGRVLRLMDQDRGTVYFTRITSGEGSELGKRLRTAAKIDVNAQIDLFPTPVP